MHCQFCGLVNGEDDHRCLRCGRRMAGIAIAAPPAYIGATALAVSAMPSREARSREARENESLPRAESAEQPPLFQTPSQKVIPFEQLQRHATGRLAAPQSDPPENPPGTPPVRKAPASPRTQTRKTASQASQGSLDFRPDVSQGERILATGVPAQVYGDGRVAPPARRVTAGAMDVSMVLLGFGMFAGAARMAGSYLTSSTPGDIAAAAMPGSGFGAGKVLWITLAASLILISLFYGLLWAIARRETAGMSWTQLHLVTFDGSPLSGRDRAIRFVSAWLSFCSGGMGLLWALADEENLAFHDHISKTYPAEKPSSRVLVRQRR